MMKGTGICNSIGENNPSLPKMLQGCFRSNKYLGRFTRNIQLKSLSSLPFVIYIYIFFFTVPSIHPWIGHHYTIDMLQNIIYVFGVIYKLYFLAITYLLVFKSTSRIVISSAGFKYSISKAKLYIIPERERERDISVILRGASNQIKWCLAIRSFPADLRPRETRKKRRKVRKYKSAEWI